MPTTPGKSWRCFHCDLVFTEESEARQHFGDSLPEFPAACLLPGGETNRRIAEMLRIAERAINSIRDFSCGHKPNGVGGKCEACQALDDWDALNRTNGTDGTDATPK